MPQWPILKQRASSPRIDDLPDEARERELVIGNELRFRGDLEVAAHLRIEGSVKGCINAEGFEVTVAEGGLAEANVHAETVTVRGRVVGAILASGAVRLAPTAVVKGPIHAARVIMEDGCHLAGRVDVSDGIITGPAAAPQPVIAGRSVDTDRGRSLNPPLN